MQELYDILEKWPVAIDPELICDPNNEEDKIQRAKNILSFFVQSPIEGKKILDFGCGEGHVINESVSRNSVAFGYDIKKSGNYSWDSADSLLFTNFNKIKSLRPFDFIIAYDVLDHADNMEQCVKSLRDICDKDTIVYVLTHPWCGRHGGHLYKDFNYAFAHLLFTDKDIEVSNKVVNPIIKYENLFKENEFKIVEKEIVRDPVESFFEQDLLQKKIINKFKSINKDFSSLPKFQMEQSFHEYVLKIKQ